MVSSITLGKVTIMRFIEESDINITPDTASVPMILFCPNGHRHLDLGLFEQKPHHTHACQECGIVWRPAKLNTHGVQFLPGYRN